MATKKPTASNKAAKPGRPKKAAGEKLEQFSIRLTPKMKFGLELLARAQHRSLSQSVEWALQVGLNAHFVNQEQLSVADLMDSAWEAPNAYGRAMAIYFAAPSLCDFEDYNTCLMIERSREQAELNAAVKSLKDQYYFDAIYNQFAGLYWNPLKAIAADLSSKGRELTNRLLLSDLGLGISKSDDLLESLRRAITMMDEEPVRPEDIETPAVIRF